MSGKVLIYGAGAIGRGYLAPLLSGLGMEIHFADVLPELVAELSSRETYLAAFTGEHGYERVQVPVTGAYLVGQEPDAGRFDLVFSCVGPSNCYSLAERLAGARAVFSCENDDQTAARLRELSGNPRIYFGIPDVITSNTAPAELLAEDALATVSEKGQLVLERGLYSLPESIEQVDAPGLSMHWMCKFFIHNAPHAVTAYLGWLRGRTYIHEAMADEDIDQVVTGCIEEITQGVVRAGYAGPDFALAYKDKELGRFRNRLLFDTVRRVARQPIRKLGRENRMVLGLRLASFGGGLPEYAATGLKAALAYDEPADEESSYLQSLRSSIGDLEVLREVCGISPLDPLASFILTRDISRFR